VIKILISQLLTDFFECSLAYRLLFRDDPDLGFREGFAKCVNTPAAAARAG
jgi:hypothetical protein